METLREKVAYLQGLAEGLKLGEGDEQAKILKQVIGVLAEIVDEIEELRVNQEDLESYLESLDAELFEEDEEEEEEEEGFGAVGKDLEGDLRYMEVECPKCHDIICFEEDILEDEDIVEVTCPNCNEVVFVNDGSMPLPGKEKKEEEEKETPGAQEDI